MLLKFQKKDAKDLRNSLKRHMTGEPRLKFFDVYDLIEITIELNEADIKHFKKFDPTFPYEAGDRIKGKCTVGAIFNWDTEEVDNADTDIQKT